EVAAPHNWNVQPAMPAAEVRSAPGRAVTAAVAVHTNSLRESRPVRDALGHDADVHNLDELIAAGPVAVGPLVFPAECLLEVGDRTGIERSGGDGDGQLERLAAVAEIGPTPDPRGAVRKPLGGKLLPALVFHLLQHPVDIVEIEPPGVAEKRPRMVVLD